MVMCDGDGDDSVAVNAGDDPHHDVDVAIAIAGDDETRRTFVLACLS